MTGEHSVSDAAYQDLLNAAKAALPRAYAPYSHFPVAAAALDESGKIHIGVNVENASFGLTICAERVAIASGISQGATKFLAIAVAALKQQPVMPCGACRQVIAEFFDDDAVVVSEDNNGSLWYSTVGELLPMAFRGPNFRNPTTPE